VVIDGAFDALDDDARERVLNLFKDGLKDTDIGRFQGHRTSHAPPSPLKIAIP
jgi:hypothetical protein